MEGKGCPIVIDTGAEKTFVNKNVVEIESSTPNKWMCGATGDCVPVRGPQKIELGIGGTNYDLNVYVAEEMEDSCLLGMDLLADRAIIDLQQWTLQLDGGEKVSLKPEKVKVQTCSLGTLEEVPAHVQDLLQRSSKGLTQEQVMRLRNLLKKYAAVFSQGEDDLGCTNVVQHRIDTGSSAPMRHAPRRVAPVKRQEMEQAVKQMLEQGIIEKSDSPWSSAVVLVQKKDGSTRFCVDYRDLNDLTVKDSYPLPRIDDTLDALAGAQWFSTIDLKSGYHQVLMAEEDKAKTAFSFGQGLWQFKVMPFGLCNAPATFERLMERVLEGLLWKAALVYLDDVLVYGNSFEEELSRLETVFQRMQKASLKLNPLKCELFCEEVPFLGHLVSREGVKTDPQKVAAVRDWPTPCAVTDVRSFVGLCTYYRRFVRDFASVASPLHRLTEKGAKFEWNDECEEAFCKLKEMLMEAPVLQYPDPGKPYILDCDASSEGIGSVLSQEVNGEEMVVSYYSSKFTKPERNYCVTRKELLAIIKSVDFFHHYLYGARFVVRTDHAALRWLKTLKNPEGQLARWIGKLEQHDYEIVHRSGRVHSNADALSRRPCPSKCQHCSRREATECKRTRVQGEEEDEQNLRGRQQDDADIGPVLAWRETDEERPAWAEVSAMSPETKLYWKEWNQLFVEEGVLKRKWLLPNSRLWYVQTIVPRGMRERLLKESHDNVTGGHLGVKKTLSKLRQRFYWVNMRRDVQEWCRVCSVCNSKKGPAKRGRAPIQVYQVGAPMERVAVDIAGPFPRTAAGDRFICVAMDYFTKWPEAYPLPDHEAATVASVLVSEYFARFGVPEELHSDQGREFEVAVFTECCSLLGLRKTRTTPLRPQSDGMVERLNRTMVQDLAKYCGEAQDDWDVRLPMFLMAYRSAEHEATSFTPARLMLGREIRLPVDLVMGRPPGEEMPTTTTEYAVELRKRMEDVHREVRGQLKFAGEAMRRHYDRDVRAVTFKAGDRVWLYNPKRQKGKSPKLMSPWEGPYEVLEKVTDVTFRIRKGNAGRKKIIHSDRLWTYQEDPSYTWSGREETAEEPPVEEDLGVAVDELVEGPDYLPGQSVDDSIPESASADGEEAREGDSTPGRRPQRKRAVPERFRDFVLD